jgi:cathepsin A (carboxypeptidase C)
MFQGDGMHNSAALLPDLIALGIRVLVYAGEADMMCNYVGNQQWMEALENPFQQEFNAAKLVPFVTLKGKKDKKVGSIKVAGPGAGNFTYVSIERAGHMVPFDQPEVALDLFDRVSLSTPLSFDVRAPD